MKKTVNTTLFGFALTMFALLLGMAGVATAAGPDLTNGTTRFTIDTTSTRNLGPTGLRGWIYDAPTRGFLTGSEGTMTSDDPFQILVTAVGTGTPASSKIAIDDVIVGAAAGTGPVPLFTNDTRKALGWSIEAAEAGNGLLRLRVDRYGVPTNQYYTLQLGLTGLAYSATSPYNCPKSARILADAVKVISNMVFNLGEPGNAVLGLAKMAGGLTNAGLANNVKAYALGICPTNGQHTLSGYSSCDTWGWGYRNVFLSEYYLFTGDTSVTTGVRELTVGIAKGQSMYGTFGHGGTEHYADGSLHGSIPWYGPVNSAGLVANLGIVLGKKAGAVHPEIDPAIDRATKFFSYNVDKGTISYGEHEPSSGEVGNDAGHAANGKDSIAAFLFALQGNQPTQTEFFVRTSVAGYNGRELGHTGQGFSYLWLALAANIGGTNALASHLENVRWHLNLSRRHNGSFVYDGAEQYGGSPNITNYWSDASKYGNMDPTTWYVLLHSVPNRRLYVTGKNPNPTNMLSAAAISNALWVAEYSKLAMGYTTNQLLSHFAEYDPSLRSWAAGTLAVKPGSNTLVNLLITLTTNTDPHVRQSACQALGALQRTNALAALAARLYDTDPWVRAKASQAVQKFGTLAFPQLTNMMTAFVTNATDPDVIVWIDPIQTANGFLADLLFNTLGASTITAPTNLMYAAVRAGLKQPAGMASWYLCDFIKNRLSLVHVKTLAKSIVDATAKLGPADRLFSDAIRASGLVTLGKYCVEEGIPLSLLLMEQNFATDEQTPFTVLKNNYRGAAKDALPTLYQWQAATTNQFLDDWVIYGVGNRFSNLCANIENTITAITNDTSPPTLVNYKKITGASATPTKISLPTSTIALYSSSIDSDANPPCTFWTVTQGPAAVTFTPNDVTAASNTIATFTVPGTYVLKASVKDHYITDSNVWIQDCNGHYIEFKTYTNYYATATTNLTVTVYEGPFVNITDPNFFATDLPQVALVGTNNTAVVGRMRVTTMVGATTNYAGTIAAGTPWTIWVSNLVASVTNIVTVTGTNLLGAVTNDTIQIYRTPLPFLQVTNIPGNYIELPVGSNTWGISGTNNAFVVGMINWTNTFIANAGGRLGPSGGSWTTNVPLRTGFNLIHVIGTNYYGSVCTSSVTIVVGPPPMIDITNVATTTTRLVPSTTTTQYIAGTNTLEVVGNLRWTNMANNTGALMTPGGWNFTATLASDLNVIWVRGTNTSGIYVGDTVTVNRAVMPFVNITNAARALDMNISTVTVGGTNNAAAVGYMTLQSKTGAVVNYSVALPVTTPWTVAVSNLIDNATNFVLMTVTNFAGEAWVSTNQIYRRPLAVVDITNLTGIVQYTNAPPSEYFAGTNNSLVVGGLAWTNSLGGGGTLTLGGWNFTAAVYPGSNVVTVTGTNIAGDLASDTVTLVTPASPSNDFLSFGPGADISGTNIYWALPYGTDISALSPTYKISPLATADPPSGATLDFTTPRTYTVTAEDLSVKEYMVRAIVCSKPWISVNLDATPQSGLEGPAGGVGYTWNHARAVGTVNNLTNSDGVVTTVGYVCTADGMDPWPHAPQFSMLRSAARSFGWTAPYKLNISGLRPERIYNLYIAGYYPNENGSFGSYVTTNITTSPRTNVINNAGPNGNDDTWVQGTNYVRFLNVYPNPAGYITIDIVGSNGCRAMVSGFQIVEASPMPGIDITNVSGFVITTNAAQYIFGTNTPDVIDAWWTNANNGQFGAIYTEPGEWNFTANLAEGINLITVRGTNVYGMAVVDSVSVYRVVAPFVDITNANFTCSMNTSSVLIGGTNNAVLGSMSFVSVADGVTNYEGSIPAVSPWTLVVSNLAVGAQNFVTVTVTNPLGEADSDTVVINRRPLAIVDITNVTGTIAVSAATTNHYIAGTNNELIVGGLWWTNALGGGGILPNGNWSFDAPLYNGNNVITVSGTNSAGDVGTDSVTICRPVQLPVMDGLIVWVRADAVDTNDMAQVRIDGSDTYVHQWYDQTFYGHNASNTIEADQPQYIPGALNGQPVLRFAEVDNDNGSHMYLGDLSAHFPSAASLFTVGTISNDGRYTLFGNRANDDRWVADTWTESTPGSFRVARANFGNYAAWPHDGSHIFTLESGSAGFRMTMDGTNLGSASADYHTGSGANWTIGNRVGINGAQLRGDIPELLLYNRVLSSNETAKVGRYLADKYGITAPYPPLVPEATILLFGSPSNLAVIAGTNITWTVPYGSVVTNLAPIFILSAWARCDKVSGATNDYTSPMTYTVISADDATTNIYTVTVIVYVPSSACAMLSFGPDAVITGTEISWRVPYGTSLSSLSPTYTVSPLASGDPASGTTRDFSTPQTYTVIAEDLSSNIYTVTVSVSPQAWINVNVDPVLQNNLVGPNGGSGATWNAIYNVGTDITNALDYASNSTPVRIVLPSTGGYHFVDAWSYPPELAMLRGASAQFGWNEQFLLYLYGLDTAKKYDLYIGSYYANENGSKGMFWTDNATSGSNTNYIDNGGYHANNDTYVQGANFIRFADMVPDGSSNITINIVGLGGCRAMLCGFQLVAITPPLVKITNVTGTVTVPTATTTQYIAGTNNAYTVGMWWTNVANNTGGNLTPGTWNFTATLYPGNNVISVRGTNDTGDLSVDTVTIIRAVPPYVNITNVNFTVGMNVSAVTIAGTNNTPGPVGNMQLTSVTGTTTNYAAVLPAVTPWTAVVSNLVAGETNFVTMTVTNGVGVTTNDTVQIYRRPLGIVDITNIVGSINTTNAIQKIAGTNNSRIVGGMIWSNSMGGGAKFASASTGWTFNVTLSNAANVITVWGTNTAGDVASDSVTVMPPSASNDILSCSFGLWGAATIIGTNISINILPVAPLAALAPTFVVSDYATINPLSGSTNDFTTPKFYTATSQSGSNKQYKVTVTTWPYAGSLYVLTTPQGANLPGSALETNFPLLVRLSTNNFNFGQAQTNGSDIRFYLPNGTTLPYQIEEWKTNAGAAVWVLMPFIKGNTNQEFRMCWGLAGVTNESSGPAVFNTANGYACVMHLNRNVQDATGSCTPTNNGAVTSTAVIGSATYNLTNGSISCANVTNFPAGINPPSTSVLWLRARNIATWAMPLCWGNSVSYGWNTWEMQVGFWNSPENILPARLSCWGPAQVLSPTRIEKDRWYHVVYTTSNGTGKVYVDGLLDGTASGGSITITNPQSFSLSGGDGSDYDVDEMRISSLIRAADWIKMEYENQKIQQTAVGPLVQPGTNFSVVPSSVTMNENTTTNFTAQAGGAIKLYWVKREAGVDTLLAVDQPTLTYTAGRVVDNQSFSIQLRAVYLSGVVLTSDTPVTVLNSIPEPVFTLLPSTNLWDGRSVMTVKTNISNWAAMLASGYTNLTYNWTIAGVAVTKVITPGLLTLTRAQGSGPMTVYLVMDNGGAKITNTTLVTVQEPTNDVWVVRTPATNEVPVHNQFYARDDSNYGPLYYNGSIGGSPNSVFIRVYTNGGGADVVYTNVSQAGPVSTYTLTAKIPAGLITHKVEFYSVAGTTTNLLNTVTNIVCGDAYIVDGQSNAESNPDDGPEPNPYTNRWIRSYGLTLGWGYGTRDGSITEHKIGHWAMDIASNLVAVYKMPVCFINGAVGGTRIDVHLPNPANHFDMSGDGYTAGSVRNYGRILTRVANAKLTHGIRGHFWHHGENNSGSAGPDSGYDYQFYQQYFVDMAAALIEDFPNLKYYYLFQVYPRPCSMGPKGDQIREVQRSLSRMFSQMKVMSTVGNQPPVGCHTTRAGYLMFANLMGPLVKQDIYGYVPSTPITAPDVKSASFTSTNKTAIALVFGQPIIWKNSATNLFYLNYQAGKVASGSVASNVVILQLTAPTTNTTITYVNDAVWNQSMTNWMIYGSNGIAALTFADVPLIPQVIVAPPFINITNVNFSVGMNVTNTIIGGTNNTYAVGFMRLVSMTGPITNYTASIAATTPWSVMVSNLVAGAANFVTMTVTNMMGETAADTIQIYRDQQGQPSDIEQFQVGRGAEYGQVSLAWSNGTITVLACTNRIYGTNDSDWFVLAAGVSAPWTHTAASNFPSIYYRIVSGSYTSSYDVGKFDVSIAAGSIAWLSFPFGIQPSCNILSEWFGRQLDARVYSSFNFPSLQRQSIPGGTIENSDYCTDDFGDGTTNFFPDSAAAANAGYVLFLPKDHGAVKVTAIGMVQTNSVTMQIPYNSVPWVGLAYPITLDMRDSSLADLFVPAKRYSTRDYDYIDSQRTPGGRLCYAEYYIDDWGSGTTNFFPSRAGADKIEGGKGYLLFFSTSRAGTGVWNCARPY